MKNGWVEQYSQLCSSILKIKVILNGSTKPKASLGS